jgi:hypothetical protein
MSGPKKLRDLPGFDDAMVRAVSENEYRVALGYEGYPLQLVGEISIPSLKRVSSWTTINSLALVISLEQSAESLRLRVLPKLTPIAANDSEASQ